MKACLRKVHHMASNHQELRNSAHEKLYEFVQLLYPWRLINAACKYMAISTASKIWFDIRDDAKQLFSDL